MQFIPYLNFNGNCAEAFAFYARLFGGTIVHQSTASALKMRPPSVASSTPIKPSSRASWSTCPRPMAPTARRCCPFRWT